MKAIFQHTVRSVHTTNTLLTNDNFRITYYQWSGQNKKQTNENELNAHLKKIVNVQMCCERAHIWTPNLRISLNGLIL